MTKKGIYFAIDSFKYIRACLILVADFLSISFGLGETVDDLQEKDQYQKQKKIFTN